MGKTKSVFLTVITMGDTSEKKRQRFFDGTSCVYLACHDALGERMGGLRNARRGGL